jgi:hypothetical protein
LFSQRKLTEIRIIPQKVKFGNEEQYIKTPSPPPLPQPNPSYANTNNEEKKDEKEVVKRSLNVNYV